MSTAHYECRDIGYGVESGEVLLPPLAGPDWTGKSMYVTTLSEIVYLFRDEVSS